MNLEDFFLWLILITFLIMLFIFINWGLLAFFQIDLAQEMVLNATGVQK